MNMFFWKGLGAVVVLIAGLTLFLVQLTATVLSGNPNYFLENNWLYLIAGAIGGTVIWFVGKYLNSRPAKKKLDPKTNKEIMVKPEHSLFWIKFEYWAFIVGISGIIYALPD